MLHTATMPGAGDIQKGNTFVHRFRTSKKRTVIKVWLFGVRASIRKSIKLLVNFKLYFIGSTCVRATYTDLGNKIGVFNEQVNSM